MSLPLGDLAGRLGVDASPDDVELALRLTRLVRLNVLAVDATAEAVGITTPEAVVLVSLAAAGPPHVLSPTALHGVVVQSPGGITKTLRRLEQAGLVGRRVDPADRRSLLVELTEAGRDRAREVLDATTAHYRWLLADVDDDDLRTFAAVSGELLGRLEGQLGFRPSRDPLTT